MATTRSIVAKLKKHLLSRTLDGVRSGVELAIALDDAEVVDALLEGVEYRHQEGSKNGACELTRGRVFRTLPKKHEMLARQAIFGLVARGKGARAEKLRTSIEHVAFTGTDAARELDPSFLVGLPIRHLRLSTLTLLGALNLSTLETVWMYGATEQDTERICAAPRLRELHVVVGRIGELKAPALEVLTFQGRLTHTLHTLPRLRRLDLHLRHPSIIPELDRLVALRELRILGASGEVVLGELPALVSARIGGKVGAKLVTHAPLRELRELRLGGVELVDPSAFVALTHVSTAQRPDIEKLAKRDPPKTRRKRKRKRVPGLSDASQKLLRELEPVLNAPSFEHANQIADALAEHGDAALYDHLLAHTKVTEGGLDPGRHIRGSKKDILIRRHLTRRLLAEAPKSSKRARPLRDAIHSLVLTDGSGWRRSERACLLDLAPLPAFPNLRVLDVGATPLDLAPLGRCTALQRLRLDVESIADLGFLSGLTQLTDLRIDRAMLQELAPMRGLPLASLHVTVAPQASLEPLRRTTTLRTLSVTGAPESLAPLETLHDLRELRLLRTGSLATCPSLPAVEEVTLDGTFKALPRFDMPHLHTLTIGGEQLVELAIQGTPRLRMLRANRLRTLRRVSSLPASLRVVELEGTGAPELTALGSTPLRMVRFRRIRSPTLEWLRDHPTLQAVWLTRSEVRDVSAAASVPTLRTLILQINDASVDLGPLQGHPALETIAISKKHVRKPRSLSDALHARLRHSAMKLEAAAYLD